MSAPRETVQTHCEKLRCFVDYIDSPYALLGRGLGPLVGEGKAESRCARESTGTGGGGHSDGGWRGKGRALRHLLNWDKDQDTRTHELMGALV